MKKRTNELTVCDNCEKEWFEEELKVAKDYFERISPGQMVPSGECPACGAFCYPAALKTGLPKGWQIQQVYLITDENHKPKIWCKDRWVALSLVQRCQHIEARNKSGKLQRH